jgi:hypothetical protein
MTRTKHNCTHIVTLHILIHNTTFKVFLFLNIFTASLASFYKLSSSMHHQPPISFHCMGRRMLELSPKTVFNFKADWFLNYALFISEFIRLMQRSQWHSFSYCFYWTLHATFNFKRNPANPYSVTAWFSFRNAKHIHAM